MKINSCLLMGFLSFARISLAINIIEEQCSCSCCTGFSCTLVAKPDFSIPLCAHDDSIYVTYCKRYYPMDCDNVDSETFAVCISDGSIMLNDSFLLFLSMLLISVSRWNIIR